MTARPLTLALLLGSIASFTGSAFAQQPPPVPAVPAPTIPAVPATPAPTVTPPATTTAPVAAPTAPAPAPQGAAPAAPAPGQASKPGGIAVPEVTVTAPEPTPPKPPVVQQAAPKPKPAAPQVSAPTPPPAPRAAAPAPRPRPVAAPRPAPQPAPAPVVEAVPVTPALGSQVQVSPGGGSIAIEKYSGSVSTVSAAQLGQTSTANITDALQQRVPGVVVTDASGNAFQQEINFRGFQSTPVNGNAQGLAVYQNGVRVNEVFGDTMNFDQIPSVAISDITVLTGNPVYGLNAIGGAIVLNMKDGFTFNGTEIDTRFGSFGRRQASVQSGGNIGNLAGYVAFEGIKDDGWRDRSDSTVKRLYADLGYRDSRQEYHLNFTGAHNKFGATAATPIELVNERYGSIFTSPQTIDNKLAMLAFNGQYALTSTAKLSGNAYFRRYKQKRVDGNLTEVLECEAGIVTPGGDPALCFEEDDNSLNGASIAFDDDDFYGAIDRTFIDAKSGGGTMQLTERAKLFGLGNQFIVGASLDYGRVRSGGNSELGEVGQDFVVTGNGIILRDDEEGIIKPIQLRTRTEYYGFFISDTIDLTSQLALTLGGRYNIAKIELKDGLGDSQDLAGSHRYERFNPSAGLAYQFAPNATVFGGYSEANRAPTPAELACSDPEKPCLLENFLAADPPLKQVVSRTIEGGFRGFFNVANTGGRIDWSVVGYRAENEDDIIAIASPIQGRGFFQNAGTTQRQGVDVSLSYKDGRFSTYVAYGFVDATYQSTLELASPGNPSAVACTAPDAEPDSQCVTVRPGNSIGGVPQHRFKAGLDYFVTPKWMVGADLLAVGDQFFRGDEANQNDKLDSYAIVNLRSSYDVSKSLQIYGVVNNVFDERHGLFGTYFNPGDVENRALSNPRTITPGAPFGAYGGVKFKF